MCASQYINTCTSSCTKAKMSSWYKQKDKISPQNNCSVASFLLFFLGDKKGVGVVDGWCYVKVLQRRKEQYLVSFLFLIKVPWPKNKSICELVTASSHAEWFCTQKLLVINPTINSCGQSSGFGFSYIFHFRREKVIKKW